MASEPTPLTAAQDEWIIRFFMGLTGPEMEAWVIKHPIIARRFVQMQAKIDQAKKMANRVELIWHPGIDGRPDIGYRCPQCFIFVTISKSDEPRYCPRCKKE